MSNLFLKHNLISFSIKNVIFTNKMCVDSCGKLYIIQNMNVLQ